MGQSFVRTMSIMLIMCALCLVGGRYTSAQAATPPMDMEGFAQFVHENKGKVILVNFFASWCPPCKEEVPDLVDLRKHFSKDEVVFVGVSVDVDPLALAAFMGTFKINYPVYLARQDVQQYFSIRSIPHNLVYNTKGEIVINAPGLVPKELIHETIEGLLKK